MDGISLLEEAAGAGLKVRRDGNTLVIRGPRSAERLAKRLLEHKPEVLNLLEHPELPAGAVRLLERLRKGIEWLMVTWQRLSEAQDIEERMREHYLRALDTWDGLEAMLRFTYPEYRGCVLGRGQHCPPQSPISCRACAGNPAAGTYQWVP